MIRQIEIYAKSNKFSKIHPLDKLLICILPIIIVGISSSIYVALINIAFFIVLHYICNTPYFRVLQFIMSILFFYIFSSVILLFEQGVSFTVTMILKGISSSLCVTLLVFTTPFDNIINYFSKFKYTRDLCDIAKNTKLFFIVLEEEGSLIVKAMQSRGGFNGVVGKVKDMIRVFILIFYNSLKKWQEIQEVLIARSYKGRTYYKEIEYIKDRRIITVIIIYNTILLVFALSL